MELSAIAMGAEAFKADDLGDSQSKLKTSLVELEEHSAKATQFYEGSRFIVNQDADARLNWQALACQGKFLGDLVAGGFGLNFVANRLEGVSSASSKSSSRSSSSSTS